MTLVCIARSIEGALRIDVQYDSSNFPPVGALTFGLEQAHIRDDMLLVIERNRRTARRSVGDVRVKRGF
jgi:hypothetical protein